MGLKKLGGTKNGLIGATLGLLIGLVVGGPFGLIFGSFFGALSGEYIQKNNLKQSLKPALGTFVGIVTGNGNASKEQVAKMLQSLLNIKELPKNLDSTDGLAAAVCHFYNSNKSKSSSKNYSGWTAFVKNNNERIKK